MERSWACSLDTVGGEALGSLVLEPLTQADVKLFSEIILGERAKLSKSFNGEGDRLNRIAIYENASSVNNMIGNHAIDCKPEVKSEFPPLPN